VRGAVEADLQHVRDKLVPPKPVPTYAKEKLQEQLTAFFGKTDPL